MGWGRLVARDGAVLLVHQAVPVARQQGTGAVTPVATQRVQRQQSRKGELPRWWDRWERWREWQVSTTTTTTTTMTQALALQQERRQQRLLRQC